MIIKRLGLTLMFLAGLGLIQSCGETTGEDSEESSDDGSGDGDGDGDGDGTTPSAGSLSVNSLAASYPEGLSVTSFPEEVDETPGVPAAGTLSVDTSLAMFAYQLNEPLSTEGEENFDPQRPRHPKKILLDTKDRLDGSAENCFERGFLADLLRSPNISEYCFGFDYGIVSGTSLGTGDGGQVNNIVNGLTNPTEEDLKTALAAGVTPGSAIAGEACMVAVSKFLVSSATYKVDAALKLFQGMLCEAQKTEITDGLPPVGSTVDMKATFTTLENSNSPEPIRVSSASLSRLADQSENPVYKSQVSFDIGSNLNARTFEVTLVHSPSDENNETYKGVLSLTNEESNAGSNFNVGTSISYQKSGTTLEDSNLKFEVRNMVLREGEVLNSKGEVDYEGQPQSAGNETLSGIRYFAFDINPSTYAGNLSFWVNPGGNYQEAPRGFTFETEQDPVTGALTGCAYGGAYRDGSIRKAFTENQVIKVNGCYTPQISNGVCGGPGDNQGPQVWKQCFSQNPTSGVYEVTTTDSRGYEVLDGQAQSADIPAVDLRSIDKVESID